MLVMILAIHMNPALKPPRKLACSFLTSLTSRVKETHVVAAELEA